MEALAASLGRKPAPVREKPQPAPAQKSSSVFLGDLPRRNAYRFPGKPAIETASANLTWLELNDSVNRLANGLRALGLQKGDRLAILCAPSVEVVQTYFAAAKAGIVIVPIHTGLVEKEVGFILSDVGASAIVVEEHAARQFAAAIRAVPSLRTRIVIGSHDDFIPYATLLAGADAGEPDIAVEETELFAIRFTSGTTGLPKGCPSTHRDWLRRSMNFLAHISLSHHDRALSFAPLSLGVGSSMLMSYALAGATIAIKPRFDPSDVLRTIAQRRITTFMMPVPTLFARFLDDPVIDQVDLGSLRIVGYGGAVFPIPLLLRTLERFPCEFFGVYGHLEAGGFSTYLMPEDHRLDGCDAAEREKRLRRLGSCGREALQADVRVVDEDGRELPRGEMGELVVRTEGMITQYWNRPGEIEKSLRNGWFHTGDGASIDADGYVYISDRLKDVIRTGGMNVSSVEVENILMSYPGVVEAAVVGIPDPRWGESVVACVVRGDPVESDALIAHCRAQLANYKVPKQVEFVDVLPKNSMGKVLKRELRMRYSPAS
jgi:acyl-CoA synthetase (AMP-forming)/AMP-acid ligase II